MKKKWYFAGLLILPLLGGQKLNAQTPSGFVQVENSEIVNKFQDADNLMKSEVINNNSSIKEPSIFVDPYGVSPNTAYIGIISEEISSVSVTSNGISDVNDVTYRPNLVENENVYLIPIFGMYSGYENSIDITYEFNIESVQQNYKITTAPLTEGFHNPDIDPIITGNNEVSNGLYTVASQYHNVSFIDSNGDIRGYIIGQNPSIENPPAKNFNTRDFIYAGNNRYIITKHKNMGFYVIDLMGKVYQEVDSDSEIHHGMHITKDKKFIVPSQDTSLEGPIDGIDYVADGVSVINPDGTMYKYIDFKEILDVDRPAQPDTGEIGVRVDAMHINANDYDEPSDTLITSSRAQNAIVGTSLDGSEIKFILGPHDYLDGECPSYSTVDCSEIKDYSDVLLNPVDSKGQPYNLEDPATKEMLDKSFWNWAQHAPIIVDDEDENIIRLLVFNNGDYKSYDPSKWVMSFENTSSVVEFEINLEEMTVKKNFEFGNKAEDLNFQDPNEFYSSFVSNVEVLENGNYLITFGGIVFDEYGVNIGVDGDYRPEINEGTKIISYTKVLEINPVTRETLYEIHLTHDVNQSNEDEEYEFFTFKGTKINYEE